MCTHGKWIYNKYVNKHLYVACGHCESCRLEKANRQFSRICNHERDQRYFRVFITLNYCNEALPYIDFNDYDLGRTINVYRDVSVYYHKNRYTGVSRKIVKPGRRLIGKIQVSDYDYNRGYTNVLTNLVEPQKFHRSNCIGISFTPDFQNFLKRFRQNLFRHYGLQTKGVFTFYRVSEYGPTTMRPHFHAIFYFPREWQQYYVQIKRSVIASWPFCSYDQIQRNVQVAKEGQRYVSRYTCRPSDFPTFFNIRKIAPKASFSRGYGFGDKSFTASSVFRSLSSHDYGYTYEYTDREGKQVSVHVPFPSYYVRRFFPTFKGECNLDARTLFAVLSSPGLLYSYASILDMSFDECRYAYNRIICAQERLNLHGFSYAFAYLDYKSGRSSYLLKRSHLMRDVPLSEFYDNKEDLLYNPRYFGYRLFSDSVLYQLDYTVLDPNLYYSRVIKSNLDHLEYCDHVKKAKFTERVHGYHFNYITYKVSHKYGKRHKTRCTASVCRPSPS